MPFRKIFGVVAIATVLFALSPMKSQAYIIIPSMLMAQTNGTDWQVYFDITANPDAQTGPFGTFDLTTDNGRYGAHLSAPGVITTWGEFNSVSQLIASLPSQWTIQLDAGLATQRVYTTTLSIGNLASATSPIVTSPIHLQTISDLHPSFYFSLPSYNNAPYVLTLQRADRSYFEVNTTIPPTATSWTVPSDLDPGFEYFFSVYRRNIYPGFQFSSAIDANNQPLGGFGGGGNLTVMQDVTFFTTTPEPATTITLLPAAFLVLRRRKNRYQNAT